LHHDVVSNQTQEVSRKDYHDHLITAKKDKQIRQDKLVNQTKVSKGIGRTEGNLLDHFILTRKLNFPQLVFNQNSHNDQYFERDHADKWQLSQRNDCYICQKYVYTIIFYDQRPNSKNSDLIEICPLGKSESKPAASREEANLIS